MNLPKQTGPRNRQEAQALYEIFSGPAWEYLKKEIEVRREQAMVDLITSGSQKHDFNVGRLRGIESFMSLRDDFIIAWKKLADQGDV